MDALLLCSYLGNAFVQSYKKTGRAHMKTGKYGEVNPEFCMIVV